MRTGTLDNPPCYYQMQDCAANYGGVCLALQSTRFKRGYCPFYKSRSGVQRKASGKVGRKDETPEEKE
jgi:hypothetical protein